MNSWITCCKIYIFIYCCSYIPSLHVCLATQKKNTDKPSVVIRFEPPSPIIENDHVNVTLHCDTIDGNPLQLLRVRWMMNGDKLTELPECNGKEEKFRPRLLWVLHLLYLCVYVCKKSDKSWRWMDCVRRGKNIQYPLFSLTRSSLNLPSILNNYPFTFSSFYHFNIYAPNTFYPFSRLLNHTITHSHRGYYMSRKGEKIDISENIISKICHEHPLELSHSNSLISFFSFVGTSRRFMIKVWTFHGFFKIIL